MRKHVLIGTVIFYWQFCMGQVPTQTIRGIVLDAKTRESLPAASIIVLDKNLGTTSNLDGYFLLENIPVGRYDLEVRYLGYTAVIIPELLVGSGKEVVLQIEMESTITELQELTVKPSIRKDKPVNSMASVSARTFSVEEASRYAGTIDDPGRMAGNFAGVTTAGPHVNAIVIRGNAPKGLLWRLEGMDIPVPSHFSGSNIAGGGSLTMFSSQLLANSEFYTGAFPAEYGNATAGVFDMKLRNGNNRKDEYAFQIGIQGIEAATEGPFSKRGSASYLVNYRYSTMALVFPLLPEVRDDDEIPVYQDLCFKLNFPNRNGGTLSVWGIGGLSQTTMKGSDDVSEWEYPENRVHMNFHYNMGAGGISHSKSLSDRTHLRTMLAMNAGQHAYHKKSRLNEESPSELIPLYNVDMTTSAIDFSSTLTHNINSRLTLKTKLEADYQLYNIYADARDYEENHLSKIMDGSGSAWQLKGFCQGKYLLNQNLYFSAGLNASWFEINGELLAEPRISASWQVNSKHRFSIGYGNHSQMEPLFVYFVTEESEQSGDLYFPNKHLSRMRAHHYVFGYDWLITENLRLKIEPYYQILYRVPVVEGTPYSMLNFRSDWTFNKSLVNKGTGKNMGIDVTVERFLKSGFYYLLTGSLYQSTCVGGDGISTNTRYNGNYVLNILGGKEWMIRDKNHLGLNMKYTVMGPYWYQSVNVAASHMIMDIVYDESTPFTERGSAMESMTDFSLYYRINGQKTSSVFTIQAKNMLGKQYLGKRYNLLNETIEDQYFTSLVPFVSYRLEF